MIFNFENTFMKALTKFATRYSFLRKNPDKAQAMQDMVHGFAVLTGHQEIFNEYVDTIEKELREMFKKDHAHDSVVYIEKLRLKAYLKTTGKVTKFVVEPYEPTEQKGVKK